MDLRHLCNYLKDYNIDGIPRNIPIKQITFVEEVFTDNILLMEKYNCDTKCPEYLVIELSSNEVHNNIHKICHKICFEMSINDNLIVSIPLRFMLHMKEYEFMDNKYYIHIPFAMFCDDIIIIALQYGKIIVKLTNTNNNISSVKLLSKETCYDTDTRLNMAKIGHEKFIQIIASTEIIYRNPTNNFDYCVNFNGISKGFFIESVNVNQINEINLWLNGHLRLGYNKFTIKNKCVVMSKELLYLPFNNEKSYFDKTNTGFEGSLNLNIFDEVRINIKFDTQQSYICIYGLGSNLLRYLAGKCYLSQPDINMIHEYKVK